MIKDSEIHSSNKVSLEEIIKTPKRSVIPRSKKQKEYVRALKTNQIVMSLGPAGTGKTYLAVAVALTMLLEKKVIGRILMIFMRATKGFMRAMFVVCLF